MICLLGGLLKNKAIPWPTGGFTCDAFLTLPWGGGLLVQATVCMVRLSVKE